MELDEYMYEKEPELYFYNDSIYIIHFNNTKNICVSCGLIDNINNSQILLSCNISNNLTGFPIFSSSNIR